MVQPLEGKEAFLLGVATVDAISVIVASITLEQLSRERSIRPPCRASITNGVPRPTGALAATCPAGLRLADHVTRGLDNGLTFWAGVGYTSGLI